MARTTWYYAMRPDGELCRHGGPGTLYRFTSREERDEFVASRWLAEAVPANHLWIKQAKWLFTREGQREPKGWTACAIFLVNYDMTAA